MADRLPYIALHSGWVAGRRVAVGEPVLLTAEEARYEPVAPAEPTSEAPPRRRKRE